MLGEARIVRAVDDAAGCRGREPQAGCQQQRGAQRTTGSIGGFHLVSCFVSSRLFSRTGTDPRTIHPTLGGTLCDELEGFYLGWLCANDLPQDRCRCLTSGNTHAVGPTATTETSYRSPGSVSRMSNGRGPGLTLAGKVALGAPGTGCGALDSFPRRRATPAAPSRWRGQAQPQSVMAQRRIAIGSPSSSPPRPRRSPRMTPAGRSAPGTRRRGRFRVDGHRVGPAGPPRARYPA